MLLSPCPLGLIEIPQAWAEELRRAFGDAPGVRLRSPAQVALQPLGETGWFIRNYNRKPVSVALQLRRASAGQFIDGFSGEMVTPEDNALSRMLPPRSHWWVRRK